MELWVSGISVFIALVSLYLTVKQNKRIHEENIDLQKQNLKLGLRNEREKAYDELMKILYEINSKAEGAVKDYEIFTKINQLLGKLEFLVNDSTLKMVQRLRADILKFRGLNIKLEKLPGGEERSRACNEESKLLLNITDSYKSFIEEFKKYLYVGNIGVEE
jgi:hypothetical protein